MLCPSGTSVPIFLASSTVALLRGTLVVLFYTSPGRHNERRRVSREHTVFFFGGKHQNVVVSQHMPIAVVRREFGMRVSKPVLTLWCVIKRPTDACLLKPVDAQSPEL